MLSAFSSLSVGAKRVLPGAEMYLDDGFAPVGKAEFPFE